MKKIIKSLVMLVAVGSLFTSCITPDEPQGVYELRHAKAEYINALKDLTNGQQAVLEAEAAYKNAQADVEKANAALINAQVTVEGLKAEGVKLDNEAKKIANDAMKIALELENARKANENTAELEKLQKKNEALASDVALKIAQNNAEIAKVQDQAKVDAVKAQEALAVANADLQNTLDSIAAYAMLLSEDEGTVVVIATQTYLAALDAYNNALADYTELVAQTYIDTYDSKHLSKEYLKQELEDAKADLEAAKAAKEEYLAVDGKAESWKAEIDALEEQIKDLERSKTDVAAEQAYAESKYRQCFEAFRAKVEELTKEYVAKYIGVDVELNAEVELPNNNMFILDQFADYTYPFVDGGILDFYTEDGKLYMTVNADYEDVEGVLYSELEPVGLKEIIETFRREKVIIDNEGYDKVLAETKQAKKDADSIYFAHKAILEAGLMAYKPVADANAALTTANAALKTAQDNYDKAKKDSIAAEKAAKDAYKADTTAAGKAYRQALADAAKDKEDAYKAAKDAQKADSAAIANAAKEFAYDINYFFGTIGGGDMDTTKVFAAIKKYAEFISQYNTKQDSIFYYNGLDADNNPIVASKPIQDLTLDDMTATGLVGKYAYTGNMMPNEGTVGIPTDQIFAHVIRVLVYDNTFNKSTDITADNLKVYVDGTLTPLKDLADAAVSDTDPDYIAALAAADKAYDDAVKAAKDTYDDALADALDTYDGVVAAEHTKVADALSKLNAANAAVATAQTNLKNAKDEFYAIYDSFWGYYDGTHTVADYKAGTAFADPEDSLTVVYTEKTFVDPDNIVRVNIFSEELMAENEELAIALYNLGYARTPYYSMTDFFDDPSISYIFHNDEYNEFFDRFLWGARLEFLSQYETNLATLDALEAAVNELCKAYEDKKAEIEAAEAEMMADVAELTGYPIEMLEADPTLAFEVLQQVVSVAAPGYFFEDFIADFVDPLNGIYVYNNLPTGLFGEPEPVGGKILEVLTECMNEETFGDFAKKYAEWKKAEKDIQGQINDLTKIVEKLDPLYTAALKLEIPEEMDAAAAANYDELYKALIEYLDGEIEDLEFEIYDLQKLVDTMEAGADRMTVNAQLAEQKLAHAAEKLAVAKTNLDAAKATYDEVIAKYLNK